MLLAIWASIGHAQIIEQSPTFILENYEHFQMTAEQDTYIVKLTNWSFTAGRLVEAYDDLKRTDARIQGDFRRQGYSTGPQGQGNEIAARREAQTASLMHQLWKALKHPAPFHQTDRCLGELLLMVDSMAVYADLAVNPPYLQSGWVQAERWKEQALIRFDQISPRLREEIAPLKKPQMEQ